MSADRDPYAPPTAAIADEALSIGDAERLTRLVAAMIDGVLVGAVWFPVSYALGWFDLALQGRVTYGTIVLSALGGFLVFVLQQAWPLHRTGQTWGKRLNDIRIVDRSGGKPSLMRLLLIRYSLVHCAKVVPIAGHLFSLADPLAIFGAERRCLHDRIAGTRVINA
jgi:uncharacterized RDD family membrane protein YckC